MKNHKIHIVSLILLVAVICFACGEDDPEWQTVNEINPINPNLAAVLDDIISKDNDCLTLTSDGNQIRAIFAESNFSVLDNCNDVPDIDFSNATLVAGKVELLSTNAKIGSVNCTKLGSKYRIEVVLEQCDQCTEEVGFKYFWRLYPKFETDSNLEFDVN